MSVNPVDTKVRKNRAPQDGKPEGDPLRRWTASHTAIPAGADGALFQYLNASKRGMVAERGQAGTEAELWKSIALCLREYHLQEEGS